MERRGARITGRNILVGRGEIDLIVQFGRQTVAVEVKTLGLGAVAAHPMERIDATKLSQVRSLANQWARGRRGRVRVDFVGVRSTEHGVEITWRAAIA